MDRLVSFAVSRRFLMVGLFAAVIIGGLIAFQQLNIEAYPDPTPPMVDVVTQSPGLSAEEIERYITIPLETQVAGIKNLKVIRTISLYGLSDVKLQFSFDFTYEQALIYEGEHVRLWVARDDKSIELREIQTGLANGGLVEVLTNLKAGEKVVTKGSLFIDRAASGT